MICESNCGAAASGSHPCSPVALLVAVPSPCWVQCLDGLPSRLLARYPCRSPPTGGARQRGGQNPKRRGRKDAAKGAAVPRPLRPRRRSEGKPRQRRSGAPQRAGRREGDPPRQPPSGGGKAAAQGRARRPARASDSAPADGRRARPQQADDWRHRAAPAPQRGGAARRRGPEEAPSDGRGAPPTGGAQATPATPGRRSKRSPEERRGRAPNRGRAGRKRREGGALAPHTAYVPSAGDSRARDNRAGGRGGADRRPPHDGAGRCGGGGGEWSGLRHSTPPLGDH